MHKLSVYLYVVILWSVIQALVNIRILLILMSLLPLPLLNLPESDDKDKDSTDKHQNHHRKDDHHIKAGGAQETVVTNTALIATENKSKIRNHVKQEYWKE